MKVLEVISSLASGGAEKFVVNLSNQLQKDGHEVIVCTLNGTTEDLLFNKQFLSEKIKFHDFNICDKSKLRILRDIYSFTKKESPDVIHCHLAVLQYFLLVFFLRIPVVHTLHSLAQHAYGGKGRKKRLFKFLYKHQLVKPVTISAECHQSFKDFYHLNSDVMIKNGSPFVMLTQNLDSVRSEIEYYKTNEQTKVFIHVARYNKLKNQELLVDSFNQLHKEGADFILLIIGRDFETEEAKALREKACEKIYFLGEKSNVGDYMYCANAFCLTSHYEGLPISLLEAMSIGVVPICTAVGGVASLIKDGKTGYLAKEIHLDSYIEAIHRYLNGNIAKETIIQYYKDNYSIEVCAKEYCKVYEQISKI